MIVVLSFLSCGREESTPIRGVEKEFQTIELKSGEVVLAELPRKSGRKSVPMTIKHGESPRVVLSINGKPARFLVDTGASKSFINFKAFKQYGFGIFISKPSGFVYGAAGIDMPYFDTYDAEIKTREGDVIDVRFSAVDINSSASNMKIVGIIGIDFMVKNNVILDLENKVMYYGK